MDTRKGITVRLIVAALAALALLVGVVTIASAQQETISIESTSLAVGAEGSVDVNAVNILEPGLGAWTIDVTYDPAVLTAAACVPEQGGVCNPAFESNMVRITGASASGVVGTNALGAIVFKCDAAGSSQLTVSVPLLVDATIGDPQPVVAATQSGSITCSGAAGGDDVFDCSDFLFRDIGQAILDADPSDPHNLDPDNDGVACEDLPERDQADGFPSTGTGSSGQVSPGDVARWLMAAFAGIGLALAGGIALLRHRATRAGVHRR